jgi:hypothetical protein
MNKFASLAIGTLLLATSALAGALPARSTNVGEVLWTAVAASGVVEARGTDPIEPSWGAVSRGDQLPSRAFFRTGKRGAATLTRNANVLIVDPNSRLVLPEPRTAGKQTSVVQTAGSVVYEIEKRSSRHFKVVTPHLVAGVKGTSFLVTVTERHSSITVEDGLVEVLNPLTGETIELGAGESVFLDRGDRELQHFDRGDRTEPRVRRADRRLDRMAQRSRADLARKMNVDSDAVLAGAGAVDVAHGGGATDWVADSDVASKGGADWRDDSGAGATAWEQDVELVDDGRTVGDGKTVTPTSIDGGKQNVQEVSPN